MVTPADQPTPSNSDRALAILLHASDTLAAPGSWTKGSAARFTDGHPCYPTNDDATAWCVLGAVERGHANDIRQHPAAPAGIAANFSPYRLALLYLGRSLPDPFRADEEGISRYNDQPETSHQDIVDLLTRAVGAADRRANMLAAQMPAIPVSS